MFGQHRLGQTVDHLTGQFGAFSGHQTAVDPDDGWPAGTQVEIGCAGTARPLEKGVEFRRFGHASAIG